MYLSRVFIRNYRSIRQLDVRLCAGKNVIVGRNNSGKSNILSAIDLVLGENSPDYKKSDNIKESDFYTQKKRSANGIGTDISNEIFVWCELTRVKSEPLNIVELNKCYGFSVLSTGPKSQMRKLLRLEPLEKHYSKIFEFDDDVYEKTYLNPKLKHQQAFEKEFTDKYQFAFAFRATRAGDGIGKEIRFLYRTDNSSEWALAFKAHVRHALLQSAIIPSFRDPQNQLRITSWSWYGKLLRHLTEGCGNLPKVKDAFTVLQSAANDVFATAQTKISSAALSVAFPGTELSFQFSADKSEDLHKSCVLYVDDGFKSLLTEKGSGIQSATIIGLFNFYTREVNITGSALLGIEEPELYLHPHARRVVSARLDEFLDKNRNQVILTTHSIEFVRSVNSDVNVVLVKKSSKSETCAQSVSLKKFRSLLRDNNQNELFFADKVIVCEGFEEYVIKAASRELFRGKLDDENVSVIAVSGKDNIASLVRLILELGLECYVFADFDYLLRDKSAQGKKYNAKAHESVANLPQAFFEQRGTFGENGNEVLRQLVNLRSKLRGQAERAFFTATRAADVPLTGLLGVVAALREGGLCLLDGQIEDLSLEPTFLSGTNKLNLDKVYRIRARLIEGERLSSFMRLEEVQKFLEAVFGASGKAAERFSSFQKALSKIS